MSIPNLIQSLFRNLTQPEPDIFGGPVEMYYECNGSRILAASKPRNVILYRGRDVIARALSGAGPCINTLYIEFVKNGTTFTPAAPAKSSFNYYNTLSTNDAATSDFLRIPLTLSPVFATTDVSKYTANKVTLTGVASGGQGVRAAMGGTGFTFDVGDLVVGGALVSAVDNTVGSDLVYARFYYNLANQRQRIAGASLTVSWPLTFTDPA